MTRRATLWQRLQETPLELTICLLAAAVSVIALVQDGGRMSWHMIVLTVVLGLGGAIGAAGRLRDDPDSESAGLALLLAALLFVGVQHAQDADGVGELAQLLLNDGALVIGFGVRLYVVRRAARARRRAAEILAEWSGR